LETSPKRARHYIQYAVKMLTALSAPPYRSGMSKPSFLVHSTGHKPLNTEVDYAIIYADYYYLEALIRYKKMLLSHFIS